MFSLHTELPQPLRAKSPTSIILICFPIKQLFSISSPWKYPIFGIRNLYENEKIEKSTNIYPVKHCLERVLWFLSAKGKILNS